MYFKDSRLLILLILLTQILSTNITYTAAAECPIDKIIILGLCYLNPENRKTVKKILAINKFDTGKALSYAIKYNESAQVISLLTLCFAGNLDSKKKFNTAKISLAINQLNEKNYSKFIKAAIDNSNTVALSVLLALGAHPDTLIDNSTTLRYAVKKNYLNTVLTLIKYNPEINLQSQIDGKTALHIAAAGKDHHITSLLLNKKADPTITDKNNSTAVHIAAAVGSSQNIYELLKLEPDLTAPDKDNLTPLELALKFKHTKAAKILNIALERQISTPEQRSSWEFLNLYYN